MQVDYSHRFMKQLAKADRAIQQAFRERFALFVRDPRHPLLNNHKLQGRFDGYRSINVIGDWRAVYRERSDNAVIFEVFGTHSELYR